MVDWAGIAITGYHGAVTEPTPVRDSIREHRTRSIESVERIATGASQRGTAVRLRVIEHRLQGRVGSKSSTVPDRVHRVVEQGKIPVKPSQCPSSVRGVPPEAGGAPTRSLWTATVTDGELSILDLA